MALSLILTMTTGFAGAYDSPELMSGSFEFSSKSLYCLERTYKNKYIGLSYAKMVKQEYYYDSDCTDAVPNSNKTIYGSWG